MSGKHITASVLVTGGAGFIGSHLAEYWVKRGKKVIVIDDLSSGQKANLPSGVEFYEMDLNKNDQLIKIISTHQPKTIYHLAGHSQLRAALRRPLEDAQSNIGGTLSLIQACLKLSDTDRYNPTQIVFSSSSAVFGGLENPPYHQGSEIAVVSPYGAAKYAAELYWNWYSQQSGVKVASLRYANVYGPRQSLDGEAGVVARFMSLLSEGQPLVIYGDGTHERDYIYVDDVVAANVAVAEHGCTGVFVVGTGIPTTTHKLAELCASLAKKKLNITYQDRSLTEQRRSWLDSSRLTRKTGWQPVITLEDGLQRTAQWYNDHAT